MFELILIRMQNSEKINIGPFAELNYETATNVCFSLLYLKNNWKIIQTIQFAAYKKDLYVCDDDEKSIKRIILNAYRKNSFERTEFKTEQSSS